MGLPAVQPSRSLNLEDLAVMDFSCDSGHISYAGMLLSRTSYFTFVN
jgi:hypothetical protein